MPYQVGFCDDEIYQIKVNTLFLEEIAKQKEYDLEYHSFRSGKELRSYLEAGRLDVLLLDIDLGDENGIEIAAWVARNYPDIITVFVTGHREFAEEAFEVDVVGYLVKPYDIKKMDNVMKKVMLQLEKRSVGEEDREIIIIEENIKKKIYCKDILYIERQLAKSIITTSQKIYQVYEPLTSLCDRIGGSVVRVNQGEAVNWSLVSEIKGNTVYLKNGKSIVIGRTYRKEIMNKYLGI